jgi:gas vesicle protein
MGRFKKGLFLGGLLGAGLVWLNATTKGKHTRTQILGHADRIYPEIKKKVMSSPTWKNMTKGRYIKLVDKYVAEYAMKYKLPSTVKNMVARVVGAEWKNIQSAIKRKK